MSQFATADDLAVFLRTEFDPTEQAAADLTLAGVSATIQKHTGQRLELVTNDVAVLQGTWARELVLPQWPVLSVSSVKINGSPAAAGTWFLTGTGKLYRGYLPIFNGPDDWGGDLFLSSWLGPVAAVEVTYTHGFNPIPADIVLTTIKVAARILANPEEVVRESVANVYLVQHGRTAEGMGILTPEEQSALDYYRRVL